MICSTYVLEAWSSGRRGTEQRGAAHTRTSVGAQRGDGVTKRYMRDDCRLSSIAPVTQQQNQKSIFVRSCCEALGTQLGLVLLLLWHTQ